MDYSTARLALIPARAAASVRPTQAVPALGRSDCGNDLGGPRDGSGGDASMAQKVVDAIKAEGGRAVANGADISP